MSHLNFITKPPQASELGDGVILIYDKIFQKKKFGLKKWLSGFDYKYGVKSGEPLKNLKAFPSHIEEIFKLIDKMPSRKLTVVALGGGSIGDFAGFTASILKRGVELVHIPSTWLSAVDSAHGGKTALNLGPIKNQIGSFYPASRVYLVKSILMAQPTERSFEALGEVLKISLINGGTLWNKVSLISEPTCEIYWKLLPDLIKAKTKVVTKDPFEKKGLRQILNLGHTIGHIWEIQHKWPHGVAVLYGLAFSLNWSLKRRLLSSKDYYSIILSPVGSYLPDQFELRKVVKKTKKMDKLLGQDKKATTNSELNYIFLKKPGSPVRKKVKVNELVSEIRALRS